MSVKNTLEVEDEDEREKRIQSSLERLNTSSGTSPFQFEFTNRSAPHFVAPPTELLSRVQAFLPALEAANNDLAHKAKADPSSVDIEHISDKAERYIEMNLGLGLFEQRLSQASSNAPSHPQQDTEMSVSSESSTSDDDDDDDDDSYESDSDEDEIITCFNPGRPIKPLPRRRLGVAATEAGSGICPQIVVLGQSGANATTLTGLERETL